MRIIFFFFLLFSKVFTADLAMDPKFKEKIDSLISKDIASINSEEAINKANVVFLDARELKEYKVSHLKSAHHIGHEAFDLKKVSKDLDKSKEYIVYCSVGYRSSLITKQLRSKGFKAFNLYGGIFGWVNSGNPVYDESQSKTLKVHTYNKKWSQWLKMGEAIF